MESYTFRLLTFEDIVSINELFTCAFNSKPKNNFIEWKYFKNPTGKALLAGAFFKDELVGSGAMIPEIMNVFNNEAIVYKFTDLMTHPKHQRKGLSKKINELLNQETKQINTSFSYTLCSTISTKSFVSNNWIHLKKVINFFKPYFVLKINIYFRKKDFTAFGFYNAIQHHLDNYNFIADTTKISLKKTIEYIKWRTSNPNFNYKLICSYDSNVQVNGYLIYSISANNLLNILDIDSTNKNKSVERKLLLSAEYLAVKEKRKGILIMAVKDTPFYYFVKSQNYLRNPLDKGPLKTILDFNVNLYDFNINNITNSSIWNINGINYDDI